MSFDPTEALTIDDPVARELPAMRAAWPAWTLAAVALLTFFLQIARGTADDVDGLRGLTLSAESLRGGQWWTLVTHTVVQSGLFGHIAAMAVFVGMGLSTLISRDKDWMGGWRMLAVFALTSAGAALVHFLSGRQEPLTGVWQGVAGLAGFYLASGRWPRPKIAAGRGSTGKADRWEPARGLLSGWVLLCLTIGNRLSDLPVFRDEAALLGVGIGGVALALVVGRWGSRTAVKLATALMMCIYALAAALLVVTMVQAAPPNFWVAPLGAAIVGVALGVIDRGWASSDAD